MFSLLGYTRLILIITGNLIKDESPITAMLFYAIFAALDGIDGWVARKLNQCSSFGAWVRRTEIYNKIHLFGIKPNITFEFT